MLFDVEPPALAKADIGCRFVWSADGSALQFSESQKVL
jgi:hypothetical protein